MKKWEKCILREERGGWTARDLAAPENVILNENSDGKIFEDIKRLLEFRGWELADRILTSSVNRVRGHGKGVSIKEIFVFKREIQE